MMWVEDECDALDCNTSHFRLQTPLLSSPLLTDREIDYEILLEELLRIYPVFQIWEILGRVYGFWGAK